MDKIHTKFFSFQTKKKYLKKFTKKKNQKNERKDINKIDGEKSRPNKQGKSAMTTIFLSFCSLV